MKGIFLWIQPPRWKKCVLLTSLEITFIFVMFECIIVLMHFISLVNLRRIPSREFQKTDPEFLARRHKYSNFLQNCKSSNVVLIRYRQYRMDINHPTKSDFFCHLSREIPLIGVFCFDPASYTTSLDNCLIIMLSIVLSTLLMIVPYIRKDQYGFSV